LPSSHHQASSVGE